MPAERAHSRRPPRLSTPSSPLNVLPDALRPCDRSSLNGLPDAVLSVLRLPRCLKSSLLLILLSHLLAPRRLPGHPAPSWQLAALPAARCHPSHSPPSWLLDKLVANRRPLGGLVTSRTIGTLLAAFSTAGRNQIQCLAIQCPLGSLPPS